MPIEDVVQLYLATERGKRNLGAVCGNQSTRVEWGGIRVEAALEGRSSLCAYVGALFWVSGGKRLLFRDSKFLDGSQ